MPKTILIADDNDTIRRALCQAFTRESDFEVCGEAHDGQEAVEKAQILHPDLIILDLAMPVMNGLEAARALKNLMPYAFSADCDVHVLRRTIRRKRSPIRSCQ